MRALALVVVALALAACTHPPTAPECQTVRRDKSPDTGVQILVVYCPPRQ